MTSPPADIRPSTTRRTRRWGRGKTGSDNICTKDESINPCPLPPESTKAQASISSLFDINEHGRTSEFSLDGLEFKSANSEIINGSQGLFLFNLS